MLRNPPLTIHKTDDFALLISYLLIFKGIHVFAALVTPAATLGYISFGHRAIAPAAVADVARP